MTTPRGTAKFKTLSVTSIPKVRTHSPASIAPGTRTPCRYVGKIKRARLATMIPRNVTGPTSAVEAEVSTATATIDFKTARL